LTKFVDRDHPFFAKPVTRWLTTIFPVLWGCFEFWMQSPFWGLLFLGLGGWAAWELLIRK
jgi:hypothetical protein